MTEPKLFSLVGEFELYDNSALGKIVTKDASNFSFITWPHGAPCLLANMYLLSLRGRPGRSSGGLSFKGKKGGSIGLYASQISQLVRYCFQHNIDFINLTDLDFTNFIHHLRHEENIYSTSKKKNESTVTRAGRKCLDFLIWVGSFYAEPNFVSRNGTIRAYEKIKTQQLPSGKVKKTTYIHHHSLTAGVRTHRRDPIPEVNIEMLQQAVNSIDSSRFVQARRHTLLTLLEYTGARRREIARISVASIAEAFAMDDPELLMNNSKREQSTRLVPATKMMLNKVNKYIDLYRSTVIRNTIGAKNDHGFIFISETTGEPLSEETLSDEISKLREHANIKSQACAHMFRHTFITNLFALLITRYNVQSPEEFRNSMVSKTHHLYFIKDWVGVKDPYSLTNYIHPAFAKISKYSEIVSSVHMIRALEIFDKELRYLTDRLKGGLDVTQYATELEELIRLRDDDFEIAKKRK
jgi:site-specific recombinase XerD